MRDRSEVLAEFFRRVRRTPARRLLTDYDGTLAPLTPDREAAVPYAGVRVGLALLAARPGVRISVVSGRAADDVVRLLDPPPGVEIWGCHGWERISPDGRRSLATLSAGAREILKGEEDWLEREGLSSLTEIKPVGLAVHLRGLSAAEASAIRARVDERWKDAGAPELRRLDFDGGVELAPAGRTKGTVVAETLGSGPEAAAACLGDDVTDEDAFAAIDGVGLGVLVRETFRPTRARAWIVPPEELLDFLDQFARSAA